MHSVHSDSRETKERTASPLSRKYDLSSGPITRSLLRLTAPILGTSLVMMLHSLVDMWCVSQLGSGAVAAAGTGGFYIWLALSLASIPRIGAQIKTAHAMGEKQYEEAASFIQTGLFLACSMGLLLGLILLVFRHPLIHFYGFRDPSVISSGITYLTTISIAMPFFLINPVFSSVYQAMGNSRLPFLINATALSANLALNLLLIFGPGPFPALGVFGAALATALSQCLMTILFFLIMFRSRELPVRLHRQAPIDLSKAKEIVRIGLPYGIQEALFALFSIVLSRLVTSFGNQEVAAYRVGAQAEAISWQTAVGFSSALTAFVGQNFGAGKPDRIRAAYKSALLLSVSVGLFASLLFFLFGSEIFALFFPTEPITVEAGALYLKILSYSQIFMCIEITTAGLFGGLGNTRIPSAIGIVFTSLRIPGAYLLSSFLGVRGIWWIITLSSIVKGICALLAVFYLKRFRPRAFFSPRS